MLVRLEIDNFILIDKVALDFENNFIVITGESGAGKSMLLKAIDFLCGNIKKSEIIPFCAEKMISVCAVFRADVRELLLKNDLDYEEELIFKKILKPDGSVRYLLNERAITQNVFNQLLSNLLIINLQHDAYALLKQGNALDFVDKSAKLNDEKSVVERGRKELLTLKKQIDELDKLSKSSEDEKDYLQYCIEEIENANLIQNEDELIKDKLKRIRFTEQNIEILNEILKNLEESGFALERSASFLRKLKNTEEDEKIYKLNEKMLSISADIEDIDISVKEIRDNVGNIQEKSEDELIERLDKISKLKRKYGPNIADVLTFLESSKEKLSLISNSSEQLDVLKKQYSEKEKQVLKLSDELYNKRTQYKKKFEAEIEKRLHSLSMPDARIRIDIKKGSDVFTQDSASFLLSINKGSDFTELKKTASGGELSRIYLCIMSVCDTREGLTEIFDECDAGLGGESVRNLLKYLNIISKNKRLLIITHSAVIASGAKLQIGVKKTTKDGKTYVSAKCLSQKEREEEIARMISGNKNSADIEFAKKLLSDNNTL